MEVFAQGNTRLRFRLPVACMAIFLLLTVIPCIAPADDNGAIANSEQLNNVNVPAATGSPSFNEPVAAAAAMPAPIKRGFYMTKVSYQGNAALTACATGYHMASIWELLDVATLNYHYKHPKAMKLDDSGNGPPSNWTAWVRTGWVASVSSTPGIGNCNNWTSASGSDYGSSVYLQGNWTSAPGPLGPWLPAIWQCNSIVVPVWCVSNVR